LPVALEVVAAIVDNQLRSIAWALAGVALLLLVATRSVWKSVVGLVPVVVAILVLLGAMGMTGVPLGIATSMFAALTVGVGVDFALHFLHAHTRTEHSRQFGEGALVEALTTTGRAIRWNATVLGLGFLVLTLSSLAPNRSLGLLLGAAMISCYGATILLLPWLIGRFEAFENIGARANT
jgi:predicted RND superfamily exporter protein